MTGDPRAAFSARFGRAECRVARAPGRVNLIGEHTDYNDGFVLPMAINRYATVAFAPAREPVMRAYSTAFDEERAVRFDALKPVSGAPTWFDYAAGVAWVLQRDGAPLRGIELVVSGDVPMGAGLSSSAALELAVARAVSDVAGLSWDANGAALAGQSVENDFIGLRSGVMDQMASASCRAGHAMLLDCRHLSFEHIPVPESLTAVVMDTGTRRSVATSAYNDRQRACQQAVALLGETRSGVAALRDVTAEELDRERERLGDVVHRRALHVVRENERTQAMGAAFQRGDTGALGTLMAGSHASLRDLYEVSTEALDRVVDLATEHPACVGARMTGAGFGGCAVALVESDGADDFIAWMSERYGRGTFYRSRPVSGAELL